MRHLLIRSRRHDAIATKNAALGSADLTISKQLYRLPRLAALALRLWPTLAVRWVRLPPSLPLPDRAIAMWLERPDVQTIYDISQPKGRRALLKWFVFHGFRESAFVGDPEEHIGLAPLHAPFPGLPRYNDIPVTWLMREIARREGYSLAELRTKDKQEQLLSWVFRKGLTQYALLALLTHEQATCLLAGIASPDGTPRLLIWFWQAELDLSQRFAGPDDPLFRIWLRANGAALCPIMAHPLIDLADPVRRRPPDGSLPFGVNLIGHARGRLGVGEDVRMAARALVAAKIPFTVCDFAAGDEIVPEEDSIDHHVSDQLPYAITMFCTTGMETLRALTAMGPAMLDRRWSIGFWPWELPEWPHFMHHAYADMSEIWASSRFTYNAYALSSPVPVRHQPMVVSVEDSAGLCRSDFGLPADRFLFAFAYDGLSHAARKNPEASIAAFDRAFPHGDEPVGLVIKGLRVAGTPAWAALEARASRDPRIFLKAESMPRAKLHDLYRAVDCFVSLHRAEGFGRNIAECMALGKPVIVTAYSGNMDFTTNATAALVSARLCLVAPGDYPYGVGQHWAEPDIDVAAAQMQRMVADPRWRATLAQQGADLIAASYSPQTVGQAWAKAVAAMMA